jgi:hypothetical protein
MAFEDMHEVDSGNSPLFPPSREMLDILRQTSGEETRVSETTKLGRSEGRFDQDKVRAMYPEDLVYVSIVAAAWCDESWTKKVAEALVWISEIVVVD